MVLNIYVIHTFIHLTWIPDNKTGVNKMFSSLMLDGARNARDSHSQNYKYKHMNHDVIQMYHYISCFITISTIDGTKSPSKICERR